MGTIITFYSYKGGVGRTMALANVAVLLAQWGHKTLIVDWDLEAPGLENYFKDYLDLEQVSQHKGLADLLNYKSSQKKHPNWQDYRISIDLPKGREPIDLITAGQRDDDYYRRVRAFDVQEFYSERQGGDFIENLRDEWKEAYDFILIDSRTGVTDIGGICTIQLPDIIALLFTSTDQGVKGTLDVARRANRARQDLPVERFRLVGLPVPSRFDVQQEHKISQEWLARFALEFSELYDDWLPEAVENRQMIDHTKLPYIPYYSFGEKLPVIEQGTSDPTSLGYAYETLAALIANQLESVEKLLTERSDFIRLAVKLPDLYVQQLVQALIKVATKRPELKVFQEAVTWVLQKDHFLEFATTAFQSLIRSVMTDLPNFLEDSFITNRKVQDAIADYLLQGLSVDSEEIAQEYASQFKLSRHEIPRVQSTLTTYLNTMRESLAAHPLYGPILFARDTQSLFTALHSLRDVQQADFSQIPTLLDQVNTSELSATANTGHIFLNYSRKDLKAALRIQEALESQGHAVWIDQSDIQGGADWIDQITEAINRCYAMVSIMSEEANRSRWVRIEFLEAQRRGKLIVPIRIDRSEIPFTMLDLQFIDAERDFEAGLRQVIKVLPPPL